MAKSSSKDSLWQWIGLGALGVGGMAVAIWLTAPQLQSPPVLELATSGGMCAGPCEQRELTVYSNGQTSEGAQVDGREIAELIEESSLMDLPLDPSANCASYSDGVDLVILVPEWGAQTYRPCELEGGLEDPLAAKSAELLFGAAQ